MHSLEETMRNTLQIFCRAPLLNPIELVMLYNLTPCYMLSILLLVAFGPWATVLFTSIHPLSLQLNGYALGFLYPI